MEIYRKVNGGKLLRCLPLFVIVFAALVSIAPAQKKSKLDWKTASISAIEFVRDTKTVKCEEDDVTGYCYRRNDQESAVIETEDAVYSINRVLKFIWQKRLRFNEDDRVKYAFYKNSIYLQDTNGHTVEFQIAKKTLK